MGAFDGNMHMVKFLLEDLQVPCRAHPAANKPERFVDIFGDCAKDKKFAMDQHWLHSLKSHRPLTAYDLVERRLLCIRLGYPCINQYISGDVETFFLKGRELKQLRERLIQVRDYLGSFNGGCF